MYFLEWKETKIWKIQNLCYHTYRIEKAPSRSSGKSWRHNTGAILSTSKLYKPKLFYLREQKFKLENPAIL